MARAVAAPWRRVALGLAVVGLLFAASHLTTRAILGEEGRHTPFTQILMGYDLTGISVRSGHSQVDDLYYPSRPLSMPELRALYDEQTCYFLYWGETRGRKLPFTRSPEVLAKIRAAWLRAILAEPGAWWTHRFVLFLAHLGIGPGAPDQKIEFAYRSAEGVGFDYRGPRVFDLPHARAVVSLVEATRESLVFRPWPYLLLGVATLGAAWWRPNRHRPEITLLGTSALVYVAPLFVIGVAAEFRYMWWPVLAAMLQLALLVVGRERR